VTPVCQRAAQRPAANPRWRVGEAAASLLLRPSPVARKNPANDRALLDRLSHLVGALEEERRRLAGRLAEIEEELDRLASEVASREDLREPSSPRR
jgi:hypothetical protein